MSELDAEAIPGPGDGVVAFDSSNGSVVASWPDGVSLLEVIQGVAAVCPLDDVRLYGGAGVDTATLSCQDQREGEGLLYLGTSTESYVTINPQTHEVWRVEGGQWQEVHVTPTGFKLLGVLGKSPMIVQPHRTLCTEAGITPPLGRDKFSILHTHIHRLRNALLPPAAEWIRTITGFGYMGLLDFEPANLADKNSPYPQ